MLSERTAKGQTARLPPRGSWTLAGLPRAAIAGHRGPQFAARQELAKEDGAVRLPQLAQKRRAVFFCDRCD